MTGAQLELDLFWGFDMCAAGIAMDLCRVVSMVQIESEIDVLRRQTSYIRVQDPDND